MILTQIGDFSTIFGANGTGLIGFISAVIGIVIVFAIITYVYMGLTVSTTAKKLKIKNPWLAWIPIGNFVLMANMAKMHWWPVLLLIGAMIPFINIFTNLAFTVFMIIWMWKICEARNRPGWWAVLIIIPGLGWIWSIVLWGVLAWSD